jgi:hypothetical protein
VPGRPAGPRAEPAGALAALEDEAREAVEVEGRLGRGPDEDWKPFRVELKVGKAFHLYAAGAGGGAPTTIGPVLGRVRGLRYPEGVPNDGGPVYRGLVVIEGEVERRGGGAPMVELTYQACDEARCLPPVTRLVRLQ